MATVKKSGGWKGSIGGTNYKSKGGKVNILGTSDGKGIPSGGLPAASGQKIGQSNYLGCGGDKGIPKKRGGNTTSSWAAQHD